MTVIPGLAVIGMAVVGFVMATVAHAVSARIGGKRKGEE
jgi:hypothetical protein